jgi:predicted DCC family thiol-disulfide oxidoreductase YuxK
VGGLVGAWFLLAPLVRLGQSARAVRRGADTSGRLLYDADCGFCTRTALWLARRRPDRVAIVPWQSVPDLAELGLRAEDLSRQAYWQGSSGPLRGGSAAIAAAMVARGGTATVAGLLIASDAVRPVADVVYRAVAARRHRMPGGTDSCELAPTPVREDEAAGPEGAPPEQSPHRDA